MPPDAKQPAIAHVCHGDAQALVSVCAMRREDLHATLEAGQRVFDVADAQGLTRAVAQRHCVAVDDVNGRRVIGEARAPYDSGGQLAWDM